MNNFFIVCNLAFSKFFFHLPMNIGIDMMGGDFAPVEAVKGVLAYLTTVNSPSHIIGFGDEAVLMPLLSELLPPTNPNFTLLHTPQAIDMREHPTKAFKDKPNSSIAVAFTKLASGEIDAFLSAGNTGAMLVGALYSIKTIAGVQRPAIASMIPQLNGKAGILLDVGLNADCKPENLNQFAILGSLYSRYIFEITDPKIGLLNVGEEEGKGNILTKATFPLLKENKAVNFIGNVEGRDIFLDKADVIVCDGFTGNVILKLAESLYETAVHRNLNDEFMLRFNYENYGGTPVLGVAKPVVIGHGISNANAFVNMIRLAEKMVTTNLCEKIADSFRLF